MRHETFFNVLGVRRRGGFTLIELIVVVLVMVVLAAMAVPRVKLALEDQERRETTRQLNAYINGAQVLAAQRGRPVGVALERKDGDPDQCMQLYIVEVPPPFSGAILDSKASVINSASASPWEVTFDPLTSTLLSTLIEPGDQFTIRFDYKGHAYPGERNLASGQYFFWEPSGQINAVPPPSNGALGYRYQIFRGPSRAGVAPLQLPGTTVIDLTVSGFGAAGYGQPATSGFAVDNTAVPVDSKPVVIMFTPKGQIERVFLRGAFFVPLGPVHLMIGRNDQVRPLDPAAVPPTSPFDPDANLSDLSNYWVSVGNRTGTVTSANNFQYDPTASLAAKVRDARRDARTAQSLGGY